MFAILMDLKGPMCSFAEQMQMQNLTFAILIIQTQNLLFFFIPNKLAVLKRDRSLGHCVTPDGRVRQT